MKHPKLFLLPAALLVALTLNAQQPTPIYDLRPIIVPSTVIDGQPLNSCSDIGTATINDAGDVAFSAYCDGPKIFTSHRVVVSQGDEIDGKFISILPIDSPIAINNRRQVAFEAWYADSKESAQAAGWSSLGIFIDNHLALTVPSNIPSASLTLTDDGRVLLNEQQSASPTPISTTVPPAQPKKGGLLDRLQIKLPKNLPVGIGPNKPQQAPSAAAHGEKPEPGPVPALYLLRANARGQVVIPVNLGPRGFVILLATPVTH
jgi:hypothetical protein